MIDILYFKNRGDIEPECILIESDVFGISKKVKEIDKDYFIVFNPKVQKFELHHATQYDCSYCSTLPFDELDERTLTHIRKHSSTRAKAIMAEMKENNERLERSKRNSFNDEVAWKAREIYTHCIRHGVDGDFDDGAFSTKWQ